MQEKKESREGDGLEMALNPMDMKSQSPHLPQALPNLAKNN